MIDKGLFVSLLYCFIFVYSCNTNKLTHFYYAQHKATIKKTRTRVTFNEKQKQY